MPRSPGTCEAIPCELRSRPRRRRRSTGLAGVRSRACRSSCARIIARSTPRRRCVGGRPTASRRRPERGAARDGSARRGGAGAPTARPSSQAAWHSSAGRTRATLGSGRRRPGAPESSARWSHRRAHLVRRRARRTSQLIAVPPQRRVIEPQWTALVDTSAPRPASRQRRVLIDPAKSDAAKGSPAHGTRALTGPGAGDEVDAAVARIGRPARNVLASSAARRSSGSDMHSSRARAPGRPGRATSSRRNRGTRWARLDGAALDVGRPTCWKSAASGAGLQTGKRRPSSSSAAAGSSATCSRPQNRLMSCIWPA